MAASDRPDGRGFIDASRPLGPSTPVWPGDVAVSVRGERFGGVLVSSLTTTCHAGTHLDTPLHLAPGLPGLGAVPIERLVGPAEVVRTRPGAARVGVADLPAGFAPRARRLLLRTDSHPLGAPIDDPFAALDPDLVERLAGRGVELIGLDTPSVDPFADPTLPAHHALARLGLTWIEGLDLSAAPPGLYLMLALPLPLVGVEASPLRVLLRPLDQLDWR